MHQKRLTYLAFSPVESLPYYDPPDIAKPPKDAHGWWAANVTEDELSDGQIAERAVTTLNALGRGGGSSRLGAQMSSDALRRPFFLGVGFHKPHMPEYCAKKYYDMYPASEIKLATNPSAPLNVPEVAIQTSKDFRFK